MRYQKNVVAGSSVYLKYGVLTNPNIPPDQYDERRSTDEAGQALFDNLAPGNYYFFAKGYSPEGSAIVSGGASIFIRRRYRQNYYEVTVDMK